jgi:hypothetical protein
MTSVIYMDFVTSCGEDFAHDVLNSASDDNLAEFLRQVRCSLPATRTHRILLERCIKYVEEPLLKRDYILRNKKDLGDIYKRKHGKQTMILMQTTPK